MAKMYLMCGLSGVGKTTYAKKFAEENNLFYLGIDDVYAEVNGDECIHENQFKVWITFYEKIHSLEVAGIDCVIDTNAITVCHRTQFLDWFPTFEHYLIYIRASEELRHINNRSRRRVIPENVMTQMANTLQEPVNRSEDCRWKSIVCIENYMNEFKKAQKWR